MFGRHYRAPYKNSEKKIRKKNWSWKIKKVCAKPYTTHAEAMPKKDPNQGENRFSMNFASANPGCSNNHIWWKLDFSALTRAQAYENISKTQGTTVLNENASKPRAFLDKGFLYRVFFCANKAFHHRKCFGDIIGPHTKATWKKSEKKWSWKLKKINAKPYTTHAEAMPKNYPNQGYTRLSMHFASATPCLSNNHI